MNIVDCRGCSPLSYVKKDHWTDWVLFFERVKDRFWMNRDVNVDGEEPPPDLVGKPPNSIVLDKNNAGRAGGNAKYDLRLEDISLIAMGKMDVEGLLAKLSSSSSLSLVNAKDDNIVSSSTSSTATSSSISTSLLSSSGSPTTGSSSSTKLVTSAATTGTSVVVQNEPLSNETAPPVVAVD